MDIDAHSGYTKKTVHSLNKLHLSSRLMTSIGPNDSNPFSLDMINSIKNTFEGENIQTQYSVLGYRIDLYFHEYKLAIEVDELGHTNRNINNEIERQKALEKELNCVFIRINPDEKDFNTFKEINKIHRHIKNTFKKPLIDKI